MVRKGWITKEARKGRKQVWIYHYYVTHTQTKKRVEHTKVVGSLTAFPNSAHAWDEIKRRKLGWETPTKASPLAFGDLARHYIQMELGDQGETAAIPKAFTTVERNRYIVEKRLIPRWGDRRFQISPREIEEWLLSLKNVEC